MNIGDKVRLSSPTVIVKGHTYKLEEAYKNKVIPLDRYTELQPWIGIVERIDGDEVLLNTGTGGYWLNHSIRVVEII